MWKYFEGLINAFPDQVTASDSNAKPASPPLKTPTNHQLTFLVLSAFIAVVSGNF